MLHEKKLLEQFMMQHKQDKHPLAASPATPGPLQSPATWEYFNLGMGLLTRGMELLSYNSALCHLCGLAPESVLNSNLYGILGIKASSIGTIRSMLESDGRWSGKIRLGDRSLRIDLASLNPAQAANDIAEDPLKPVYSVSILDYSEEFRQLQLMSEAKFQAEKTDRAKSQFLSHMSHELRTPLNAILGFAQLLSMDETLNDVQMDNVREIEGAGEYLLSLINEILDLSRIEAGRIELSDDSINFEHLLNECCALVKPLAESKNVQLEYHLQDVCLLRNDHVRLKQILINLLSNAIKYNRTGGRVILQCVATESSLIRIEILDTGNGIDKEHLPYIFTPFERLGADSRHIEGTGIGLMITRRLVKLMKGEIGVISRSGAGSIFWIDLPIHPQQESSILARGDHYSSLFNTTPIFGFGPSDSRAFKLLEDLCSIRTTILFRHDSRPDVLTDWLTQQRGGHVVLCHSALAQLANYPAVQLLLKKFTVTVVNDESTPSSSTVITTAASGLSGTDCRYADLPMVLLASPDTCKVIKQCN